MVRHFKAHHACCLLSVNTDNFTLQQFFIKTVHVQNSIACTFQNFIDKRVSFLAVCPLMAGIVKFNDPSCNEFCIAQNEVDVLRLYLVKISPILLLPSPWFYQIKKPHLGE